MALVEDKIVVQDRREKMANQLLMRGWATMGEILTMSFGEWPPKGLDVNPDVPHGQMVTFKITTESIAGEVDRDSRDLYLRDKFLTTGAYQGTFGILTLYATMGHEGIHVLQSDHSRRAREMFGDELGRKATSSLAYRGTPACCDIMNELIDYDECQPRADRQSEVISEIKQEIGVYNSRLPPERRVADDFNAAAGRLDYFKRGREMQSRIHENMIEGYTYWGRMPANRDEFYVALASFGITPPPEIAKQLASLSSVSSAHDFRLVPPLDTKSCKELALVHDSLSDPARLMFWQETIPKLYADLIEMYGDRQGRERFGFGANIKGQIQQAAFGKKAPAVG